MAEIIIKIEKLKEDEKLTFASLPSVMKEDLEDLNMFNESNMFTIKKLYVDNTFTGFAVFFLGYNGLESLDVSLEALYFFYPNNSLLNTFIKGIMNSESFPIPVENFYYEGNMFDEMTKGMLETNGFRQSGKTR